MAEARRALKARLLRQKVGESLQVAQLIRDRGPWAGLIFERLIPFGDDDGRLVADAPVVRAHTIPHHERPLEEVEKDLQAMHDRGLIIRYQVAGTTYAVFPLWRKHQQNPRGDRYIPSELPAPGRAAVRAWAKRFNGGIWPEIGVSEGRNGGHLRSKTDGQADSQGDGQTGGQLTGSCRSNVCQSDGRNLTVPNLTKPEPPPIVPPHRGRRAHSEPEEPGPGEDRPEIRATKALEHFLRTDARGVRD